MACMSSRISATTTATSTSTRTHSAICSGRLSISFNVFPRHLHNHSRMFLYFSKPTFSRRLRTDFRETLPHDVALSAKEVVLSDFFLQKLGQKNDFCGNFGTVHHLEQCITILRCHSETRQNFTVKRASNTRQEK